MGLENRFNGIGTANLTSHNLVDALKPGNHTENRYDLVNGVALFGSITSWREGVLEVQSGKISGTPGIQGILNTQGITTYNPRLEPGAWEGNSQKFIKAEADAMERFSVLGFRLENRGVVNGSVGSFTEVGFAVASAYLRGQVVVVSIEENIEDSLKDPGVLAQFEALKNGLVELSKIQSGLVVFAGSDMDDFGKKLIEAHKNQSGENARKPFGMAEAQDFRQKQVSRMAHNGQVFVTMSGSSSAATPSLNDYFQAEREQIKYIWVGEDFRFNDITQEPLEDEWTMARFWREVSTYNGWTDKQKAETYARLFRMEEGDKNNADLLLWPVHDESKTLAGSSELGFRMVHALMKGQFFVAMHEPINYELMFAHSLIDTAGNKGGAKVLEPKIHFNPYSTLNDIGFSVDPDDTASKNIETHLKLVRKARGIACEHAKRIRNMTEQLEKETGIIVLHIETDITSYLATCQKVRNDVISLKTSLRLRANT